jgi:hypothetical protein
MLIRFFASLVLILSFAACSHDIQLMRLEETLSAYGSAVRWNRFEAASDFQTEAARRPVDQESYKDIHITAYDVIYRHESDDRKSVRQTAEIRYFLEHEGVEKTITDRQTWKFDEQKKQWFLETAIPSFSH